LSYSQLSLWKADKKKYMAHYFEGHKVDLNTPAIKFGKKIADMLEAGEFVHKDIIVYKKRDVAMFTKFGGVEFIYKCDGYCPDTYSVVEYKTGTYPWTQDMVNKAMQLKFYTACIYNETKKLPKEVHLQYLPTVFKPNKLGRHYPARLELTGDCRTFVFKPTLIDTLKFSSEMVKCAREISKEYDKFRKNKRKI